MADPERPQIVALPRTAMPRRAVMVRRQPQPVEPPPKPTIGVVKVEEFLPAALEVMDAPGSPKRVAVLCALGALFVAAFAWSWFGMLSDYTEVPGRIQAVGRTKVIEPRDTEQIKAIRVKDGQHVSVGDVLVELDPTSAAAARNIVSNSLLGYRAEIARREVEIAAARTPQIDTSAKVRWDAEIPQNIRSREEAVLRADLTQLGATLADLSAQREQKVSERDKFAASVDAQKTLIKILSERVGMHEQLEKQGWDSHARLLEAQAHLKQAQLTLSTLEGNLADAGAAIPIIDGKIAKTREDFVTSDTAALTKAEREADALAEELKKTSQTLANMTLRAPIAGVVQNSAVTTAGQVVKPGQQLMQIVPEGVPLEIQAYVANTDIGFIKPGQKAEIKVDSFPYATYGSIPGTVMQVANGALADGKNRLQPAALDGAMSQSSAAQKTGDIVFPITVTAGQSSFRIGPREIPLSPGMTVTVDLKTEDRQALDYVLTPLIELLSTAGHER